MLKKKALVLSSLIRLILAFILLFFFMGCGANLYGALVGSKATKSYEGLVNTIEEMEYDESIQYNLYLDDGNAIIGFTKDSDRIEYHTYGNPLSLNFKSYFVRPDTDNCKKGTACICLCKGEFDRIRRSEEEIMPLECKRKIVCNNLVNLDFKTEINKEDLGNKAKGAFIEYTFKGGFYLAKEKINENYFTSLLESPEIIYLKKDRDNTLHISTEPFEISPE